ncbi:hypothetical protein SAMN05518801_11219 [Novosphingobium sp. CF614]|uniref:hypothetical protein n=1 Tax=Novosphingobium sp. CF614 TaxID=1884364 RepID=UPI0008E1913C|nr:hypothetical protein [Novosphingobium sp. CF614]SFG24770.1 hypothetical protein SAMN05518801_11219 [Novosphingobium sp. CF614]
MRNMMLAGAAVLALCSMPAALVAQDAAGTGGDMAMQPETSTPSTDQNGPPSTDSSQTAQPGTAQQAPAPADKPMLSPNQQAIHDAWPAARQADYEAWPNEYKVYFWTLTPERQEGYWALTADQRGQISKMSPAQQELAWNSVLQQLKGQAPPPMSQANPAGEGAPAAGAPDPQVASQDVSPAMPADESYQGGPYKGAMTAPPAAAMNKDYPVCTKKIQDSCRNRGGV